MIFLLLRGGPGWAHDTRTLVCFDLWVIFMHCLFAFAAWFSLVCALYICSHLSVASRPAPALILRKALVSACNVSHNSLSFVFLVLGVSQIFTLVYFVSPLMITSGSKQFIQTCSLFFRPDKVYLRRHLGRAYGCYFRYGSHPADHSLVSPVLISQINAPSTGQFYHQLAVKAKGSALSRIYSLGPRWWDNRLFCW